MVTKSWKLEVDKTGKLNVAYLDERFSPKTCLPRSEAVVIRDTGIEFDVNSRGNVAHVECPFENMSLKDRPPLPVAKMLDLGTFDDAAVGRLRSHVLGFVYEFVAGVCFNNNPVIVKKFPFDIDALLAEYSQFQSQLSVVDWHTIAGQL